MSAASALERIERIVDRSGVAERIEALLPVGVRPRQLRVRTLLAGMLLAAIDGRPAHLTRVHRALICLPEPAKRRLGVIVTWKSGEHPLSYRQVERTFALIVRALAKDKPDGAPREALGDVLDALLEASVSVLGEPASTSYAVDWTDHETWARPPPKRAASAAAEDGEQAEDGEHAAAADGESAPEDSDKLGAQARRCADPEASWGHRRGDGPGEKDEAFYGYYLQAATIVSDEQGPEVPELVRRIGLTSCHVDPPHAFVAVLERMHNSAIKLGDVLADCGYSYRVAEDWALPLRRLGARLIVDLHPNDRGTHGTHEGAIAFNGNLYCPATPGRLLELGPIPRGADAQQTAAHDTLCDELARHKLSTISGYDRDGYRRVACPAAQGKLRCPLRPESLTLPHSRPQVLSAPEQAPACCRQQTITVPPAVNAKTAQKHDYPSKAHRRSYARRSAAERTFAGVKDPAANDLSRGWCRLTGLTAIALSAATVFVARNLRIADSHAARQAENERRAANGLPPKQRKRRRQSAADLIATATAPP